MKFAVASLLLGTAVAQIPGLNLPSDVLSYAEGLQKTDTQAFQALLGIFTAAPVQSAAAAAPHLNPAEAIQTFEAAVNQAIAAEPDSLRPIASSIVNHIAPLALTDGLLGGGATGASSGASATMASGSATMTGSGTAMMTSGSATMTSGSAMMTSSGTMMMTSGSMTASKASGSASGSAAGTAATSSAGSNAAPRGAVAGPAAIIAGGIMAVAAL